jgi:MOB kinase activator 1
VQLPAGEDRNEWLAVTTVDVFNQLNLLYGSIHEFCTDESCPVMYVSSLYWCESGLSLRASRSAGPKYEYQWMDGVKASDDDISTTTTSGQNPFPLPQLFVTSPLTHINAVRQITKPMQVSAPKYMEYLMEWVQVGVFVVLLATVSLTQCAVVC